MSEAELEPLPPGWIWTTVSDVGEVKLGRQRAPQHHSGPDMRPYLRVANVFEDHLDLADVKSMNFTPTEYQTYRLLPGDVLLNEGQSLELVGRPAIFRGEIEGACFQNTLIRFRPSAAVESRFALVVFRAYLHTGRFQRIAQWTTSIAHLGAERFAMLEFPLPPFAEQRRIVAEIEQQFTRLDAAVAALERARANLKRYRAAVLKAACEGRLVPTEAELARAEGRGYESGEELLARILGPLSPNPGGTKAGGRGRTRGGGQLRLERGAGGETAGRVDTRRLPEVPEGWCWTNLSTLLREPLRNGKSAPTATTGAGIRVLTLTAVTKGDFSEINTKLAAVTPSQVEDLWLEPNDILIERSNTPELVGTARAYRGPSQFAIFPDLLIRARLLNDVAVRFIETVLLEDRVRRYFRSKAQGIAGTMPKIDQSTVERTPIPLPPLAEQQRIVAEVERRLSVVEELEATVAAGLRRAERLRQAILKRAFAGRLVPQDPADEPAAVLLARIRVERDGVASTAGGRKRGRKAREDSGQLVLPV